MYGTAGEKSFTTLALLLALGGVTQVPFAMFDEIVRTLTRPLDVHVYAV